MSATQEYQDETGLERIAIALERIAVTLESISLKSINPYAPAYTPVYAPPPGWGSGGYGGKPDSNQW